MCTKPLRKLEKRADVGNSKREGICQVPWKVGPADTLLPGFTPVLNPCLYICTILLTLPLAMQNW